MSNITPADWNIAPHKATYELALPDNATTDDRARLEKCQQLGFSRMECVSIGTYKGQVALIPLDESNMDNARLICAAPNLLDAMGEILDVLSNCPPEQMKERIQAAYKKGRAAYAKALGT